MNYFELYNLPTQFEVDQNQLTQAYQTLAQLTHPDKFATSSEREKLIAVQKNAQINDGYQVLKKPLSRAEHMLEIRGVELRHEQQTMQDTSFLMQQMEWREQLEELDSAPEPLDALDALDGEIQSQIRGHLSTLEALLAKEETQADIQSADEVRKLKFLYKLRDEIERKEDALSDI